MEPIGKAAIWSLFDDGQKAREVSNTSVRTGSGHEVSSFLELATKVAELQFRNRQHVLLFRGQGEDHLNQHRNTSLKPCLFRHSKGTKKEEKAIQRQRRFEALKGAENELIGIFKAKRLLGRKRLNAQRVLRWAILQHYGVCDTPLLDFTQSLRIAASFGSLEKKDQAFLFVVGVPNLSGAVTTSAEAGLEIIRLSSVCPPSAVRPHIQEGYLLGEYPEIADNQQKMLNEDYEIDFGRRLIAKFRFDPSAFWKHDAFPLVKRDAQYPNKSDPIFKLLTPIRQKVKPLDT